VAQTKLRGARFSVFEVDLELHELRKHGIRLKLTGQPFQALALLLEHPGEVVTREQFRAVLWPNEVWGEHDQRLNKIVNRIREVLSDSAETPRFIETIPRAGYRFLVQVDRFDEHGAHPQTPVPGPLEPASTASHTAVEAVAAAVSRSRTAMNRWVLIASMVFLAIAAAGLAGRINSHERESTGLLDPSPLTTYVGSEINPSFSPDGKKIVFAWDGESKSGFHIYVASASGAGTTQITREAFNDGAPAWSPDGREIAFLRDSAVGTAELWLIGGDGKGARKLRDVRTSVSRSALTWTRDRKWLIVPQAPPLQPEATALYRVSATTGEEQQLTHSSGAPPLRDLSPAVSPDGSRLAFTRSTSPSWRDIFLLDLATGQASAGAAVQLTDAQRIVDHLAWTPDGSSLIFSASSTTAGSRHLFRVEATARPPAEVTGLGIEGDYPAVGGSPNRLVFVRKNIEQSSFWRLDLTAGTRQAAPSRMFASTRRDYTVDLSPDGAHIVFSSVRSGPTEIWMSRPDGSDLRRLTSIGGSAPRWSPDGKRVAFECNRDGQPDIYVLTVADGSIQRVTSEGAPNRRPSWSRDGRFIYYSSNRTGRPQIWKLPSEGGESFQITRHGGLYAVETFDSKSLYYISPEAPAQLWTTSVNGGDEIQVLPEIVGFSAIAMAREGLFYLSKRTASEAQLALFRFRDRTSRALASINFNVHPVLSGSPDGRSVLYSQMDRQDTDLMVLDPYPKR
jgi:Tol biopolymer transport system component/DNA-binding winged helix-turn-helix (wHTH) protein